MKKRGKFGGKWMSVWNAQFELILVSFWMEVESEISKSCEMMKMFIQC